jgi:hypothetical protein
LSLDIYKAKSLTLFIPGLNSTKLSEKLLKNLKFSDLRAFNSLFSKAKISNVTALDSISRYFDLFQLSDEYASCSNNLPLGLIYYFNLLTEKQLLKIDLKNTELNKTLKNRWIYNVSPVFLYPDMAQLVLADDLTDQITVNEAKDICLSINQLFNETEQDKSWELIYYSKHQWFLVADFQLINQPMVTNMMGKALSKPIAETENSSYWVQTLNEIQMLLFSLPFNQQRAQQSKSQCNSLWLWGESYYSGDENRDKTQLWDCVYSDNYLVKQLADYSKQSCQDGYDLHSILEDKLPVNKTDHVLIVLDELESAIKCNDPFAIIDVLSQYEQQWFNPLKEAVLSSAVRSINIISNGEQSFTLQRRHLKSWWKRDKTTGKILENFS